MQHGHLVHSLDGALSLSHTADRGGLVKPVSPNTIRTELLKRDRTPLLSSANTACETIATIPSSDTKQTNNIHGLVKTGNALTKTSPFPNKTWEDSSPLKLLLSHSET